MEAIELMKFHRADVHGHLGGGGGGSTRKKMDRPQISEESTEAQWDAFLDDWDRYKASQNVLSLDEIRNELLNCCHAEVRLSLTHARGAKPNKLSEEALLARIKKAAVHTSHVSMHRKNFHNMRQEESESFNHWVTRLTQKMNMCGYTIPCEVADCTHKHNYGEILVEEAMIANMYDQESMTKIMSDHQVTNTYKKKFQIAVNLQEAGNCQQEMLGSTSASNRRSDYKSQQATESKEKGEAAKKIDVNSKGKCSECKKSFSDVIIVKGKHIKIKKCQSCFDNTSKCGKCSKLGHRPRNCKEPSKTDARDQESDQESDSESKSFTRRAGDRAYRTDLRRSNNGMRRANRVKDRNVIVSNLEWSGHEFVERPPEKQPKMKASMSVMTEAMKPFGTKLSRAEERNLVKDLDTSGLADTGAQTNSAGVSLLKKLNFPVEKMMTMTHAIRGAANSDLDVMGAILVILELNGKTSRFIMYICRNEKSVIYSRTTLRQLGLIKEDFCSPNPAACERRSAVCRCPTRTLPPPLPTEMPLPGVEENCEQLE